MSPHPTICWSAQLLRDPACSTSHGSLHPTKALGPVYKWETKSGGEELWKVAQEVRKLRIWSPLPVTGG